MFAAEFVKDLKDTMVSGIETVSITYAVFQLTKKIPLMQGCISRKKECDALRDAVKAKGVDLGPSIDTYITMITTPQKPQDAAQA